MPTLTSLRPAAALWRPAAAVLLLVPAVASILLAAGCSDPADAADTSGDVADMDETVGADIAADVATHDDGAGLDGGDGVGPIACAFKPPPAPDVDATRSKFAMSLFHYNIEYVIGGLDYTDMDGVRHVFAGVDAAAGWDDEKVEDWIVTETFAPILQMYDKHPSWGVDIELQGRFIEVLAERHPATLALLRTMAQRGQVELISFHVNDQLFLAFPREDLDRSIAETKAIFAKHCLPLSSVVFNQEGQAGEGRQKALVDNGYTTGIFPKNLARYAQKTIEPSWPWYDSEGGILLIAPGSVDPASGVQTAWDVFDDGELFSVPSKLNPYFAPVTKHAPAVVAQLEAKLQAREDAGFWMTTVGGFTAHLAARKVERKPAPPLLDGTWQAPSTDSIHRWLGGRSDVFPDGESDNRVRTENAKARREVIAAQLLLEAAEAAKVGSAELSQQVRGLWRMLWRAEVSDGSGVNPWLGERLFCYEQSVKLQAAAKPVQAALLTALGWKHATLDVEARTAKALKSFTTTEALPPVEPPIDVTVTATGRTATASWFQVGPKRHRLFVAVTAASGGCGDCDQRVVRVDFPRADTVIRYSPGLLDDEVRSYPQSAFSLLEDEVYLPLANGLVGLGGDRWVIKHTTACHIAVRLSPLDGSASFIDRSIQPEDKATWVFELFEGSEADALALARKLNTHPTLER